MYIRDIRKGKTMSQRRGFLSDYETVQERIAKFYGKYPDGRIITELVSDPGNWERCRYKALLYRNFEDQAPLASGHATGAMDEANAVNKAFHEENAESSAISRALADAGFAPKASSPGPRAEDFSIRAKQEGEHPVLQVIWDKAQGLGITPKHMKALLMQEFGVPTSKALNDVQIAQLAETFEQVDSLEEFEALLQDVALLN